jgi:hypothetical protein
MRDAPVTEEPAALTNGMSQSADSVVWPADEMEYQISNLSEQRAALRPCREQVPLLTSDSVGPLHAGMSVEEAAAACPDHIVGWDWGDEGMPEPAMLVGLGSSTAKLIFEGTEPFRATYAVTVTDGSAFRTKAGVGPGSSFAELTEAYGEPEVVEEGECVLWAIFQPEDQLSWKIRLPDMIDCPNVAEIGWAGVPKLIPEDALALSVSQVRRRGVP